MPLNLPEELFHTNFHEVVQQIARILFKIIGVPWCMIHDCLGGNVLPEVRHAWMVKPQDSGRVVTTPVCLDQTAKMAHDSCGYWVVTGVVIAIKPVDKWFNMHKQSREGISVTDGRKIVRERARLCSVILKARGRQNSFKLSVRSR